MNANIHANKETESKTKTRGHDQKVFNLTHRSDLQIQCYERVGNHKTIDTPWVSASSLKKTIFLTSTKPKKKRQSAELKRIEHIPLNPNISIQEGFEAINKSYPRRACKRVRVREREMSLVFKMASLSLSFSIVVTVPSNVHPQQQKIQEKVSLPCVFIFLLSHFKYFVFVMLHVVEKFTFDSCRR